MHTYNEEEFETGFKGKTFIRIFKQILPYPKWVIGFMLAVLLVSVIDAFFTYLSKLMIDEGILAGDSERLVDLISLYGLLIIVQAIAVFSFIYLVGILGERIRYDLRQQMFNHLQKLSLSYYSHTPVGWIMARVSSDSDRVSDLITWGLLNIIWGIVNICTALVFMLIINWQLTIIVMLMIPILIVVATEFRKRIIGEFRIVRRLNSKITGALNENITGVRVVKSLGRERANMQEFSQLSGDMYKAGYRAACFSALFLPSVQFITMVCLSSVVVFSGLQLQNSQLFLGLTIGGLQAFFSYITFMMWPIQDLARVFAEMQRSIASAERIYSLLDTDPDVSNVPDAIHVESIKGEIEFENVSFMYDDKPVLQDFSLKIAPGEMVALVGPTGGGKTTIVNLLCRFYEPVTGKIRICGKDYREYSLESLQAKIGVVLQSPHLFSGTIRENIRYGCLNATEEEIEQAAKLAGAHEFIVRMKKSYDELVGEGGGLLSVGQKQLVSLARAILADPEIFIMDEATSSVDTLTESMIQKGMENLLKGRTSVIIAHRLSTIKRADRILVIEDGRIMESGTHQCLLKQKGKYYQLYARQFHNQMQQIISTVLD